VVRTPAFTSSLIQQDERPACVQRQPNHVFIQLMVNISWKVVPPGGEATVDLYGEVEAAPAERVTGSKKGATGIVGPIAPAPP